MSQANECEKCPKCGAKFLGPIGAAYQRFACGSTISKDRGDEFAESWACANAQNEHQSATIARLTAELAEAKRREERLRDALGKAKQDIREWLQLARRQAVEMPNADYNPIAPTARGIKASEELLQNIEVTCECPCGEVKDERGCPNGH